MHFGVGVVEIIVRGAEGLTFSQLTQGRASEAREMVEFKFSRKTKPPGVFKMQQYNNE